MPSYTLQENLLGYSGFSFAFGYSGSYWCYYGGWLAASSYNLGKVTQYIQRVGGTGSGMTLTAYIYGQSGNYPSGLLGTSFTTPISIDTITTGAGATACTFEYTSGISIVSGTKYYQVVKVNLIDGSRYVRGHQGAGGSGWNYSSSRNTYPPPASGGSNSQSRLATYSQPLGGGGGIAAHMNHLRRMSGGY